MGKELFEIGFVSYLNKEAAMPKRLMEIGKYLKSTIVPKMVGKSKSLASEYASSHGPALLGGAAGFTAASGLYKNLAKGEDLDAGKMTDDLIDNIKDFGIFDIGLFGLSKAVGGMKPLLGMLKKKIGLISGGAIKGLGPKAKETISKSIKSSIEAGKSYAKGKVTPESSKLISYLPLMGAGAGAAAEYDEDSPVSSVARGAIGGGVAGKLIGSIPGVKGSKEGFTNSLLDSLQVGLGFNAVGGAFERKAKRQQNKQMKNYYEGLSSKFNNPTNIPGGSFRGYQ